MAVSFAKTGWKGQPSLCKNENYDLKCFYNISLWFCLANLLKNLIYRSFLNPIDYLKLMKCFNQKKNYFLIFLVSE